MKITIFGSYNGTSIGDTAILLGLLHGIAQSAPEAMITVLTMGPIDLSRDLSMVGLVHPPRLVRANCFEAAEWPLLRSFWWRLSHLGLPMGTEFNHVRVCKELINQDLLIIGGGNLLMDLYPSNVDLIENITHAAQATATPYCFVGVGAGPITHSSSADRLAACLASAQNVVVRDTISCELCTESLQRADSHYAPDLAFALPLYETHASLRDSLAINLAAVGSLTWPVRDEAGYQLYLDGMVRLVLRAVEQIKPALIEIITTNPAVDRCAALDLAKGLADQTNLPLRIPHLYDVTDVLVAFSRAKFAITTRLHAGIIASLAGVSVLPVSYQPKVKAVLSEVGIANQVLMLSELQDPNFDLGDVLDLATQHGSGPYPVTRARVVSALKDLLPC